MEEEFFGGFKISEGCSVELYIERQNITEPRFPVTLYFPLDLVGCSKKDLEDYAGEERDEPNHSMCGSRFSEKRAQASRALGLPKITTEWTNEHRVCKEDEAHDYGVWDRIDTAFLVS